MSWTSWLYLHVTEIIWKLFVNKFIQKFHTLNIEYILYLQQMQVFEERLGMSIVPAITCTSVYLSSMEFCSINLTTVLEDVLKISVHKMCLKFILLKSQPPLPATMSQRVVRSPVNMMTSSNGNIFRVTGHLCVEFTGPWWIPHTKASDAELWCLLWSAPK